MVSLWGRVVIILCCRLLVSLPPFHRSSDVCGLSPFAPAAEKDDNCATFAPVIHPVARTEVHPQFKDTRLQCFGRAEISRFEPQDVLFHARGCHFIQIVKPCPEWR